MPLETRETERYLDRSHGCDCCSHQIVSSACMLLRPGDRASTRNIGFRRPGLSSIPCRIVGHREDVRTGPSTEDGALGGLRCADSRFFGTDVSEKYLAFGEKQCYDDSQPEPPLFTGFFVNSTINENGDSGYFFIHLTGH
jgi:hypothetical protein